ncbi:hypothetical protein [Actinoallomurus sp. CA-150999]|uniref:hypothetical protein n=1 Tax=Actinoallomurus sp. CA-150999 TaxID=3239887 RepID=UPI003D918BDF
MARKGANTVTVMEDTSMERLVARGISKLAPLAPPWIVVVLAVIGAAIFHHMWGRPGTAPWAAILLTAGTLVLTGLTWLVTHERRGPIGRAHSTLTTFLAGGWITAATITGPGAPAVKSLAVGGGAILALSWNIRHVIRDHHGDGQPGDALNFLFNRSKDTFGLEGAQAHTKKAGEHKIEATLSLPSGEKSVDDVQKKVDYIEGGMGLPPGSVSIAPNQDRADFAHMTISDPRVMKAPIPFPGPSLAGASIAAPIRPGLWQNLDPVQYVITGHHLQLMGMVGSGKSIGGAWNILAEVVTRHDVAVFAADITKGEQTLGPLRPALHRFETTEAGVKKMLSELHFQVKPRTDWLSAHGYQKWVEGCGLAYWLVWLEEFPDIGDAIDMELFIKFLKACRSAGIGVVMSLQRSDWTQMPTIARGQLAKMCFGVADPDDADFGLTTMQDKRGARPDLWQNKQPGMAYLDAPSIPEELVALPLRTFAWGETDNEANERMHAYTANYPAAAKKADHFTAELMTPGGAAATAPAGGSVLLTKAQRTRAAGSATPPPAIAAAGAEREDQDDEEDVTDVAAEYLKTDDPNPDNTAGPDDPIDEDGYDDFTFAEPPGDKLPPEEARRLLLGTIEDWAAEGREHFQTKDLAPVWIRAKMTRQWAQNHIRALMKDGVLERDDEGRYVILRRPEAA